MISSKIDKYIEIAKQYFPEKAIKTVLYDTDRAVLSLDGEALSPDFRFIFLIYKSHSNILYTPYTIGLHLFKQLEIASLDREGNLANNIENYEITNPSPEQFSAECARLSALIKKCKVNLKLKRLHNDFT